MKRHRAEDEYYSPGIIGSGSVGNLSVDDESREDPLTVLWVPDIEQRRGWAVRGVYRKGPSAETRSVGFRRP